MVSQVLGLPGSLEASRLVSWTNGTRASSEAAQLVSLQQPSGCHKMLAWRVVGLLVCWEHETLPELEGVALLEFLEPTCLAQQVSSEVGLLVFLVLTCVLLECQVEHILRMQE